LISARSEKPRLNVVEAGSGPAFVFGHGLCGDAAQTLEVFPAGAPFRLFTQECRGHGLSEPGDPAAFSLATFADDLAEMMEARAQGPVVLGGISMGAAIALRLAITRPDLSRGLVLARPAWVAETAPANMRAYGEVGKLLAQFSSEEARRHFEQSETAAWLARQSPGNLPSLRGFFDRQPQQITAELLSRIAADGPGVTSAQIAALKLPVLIIGQAEDALHPLAHAERLATLIDGARLVTVTAKSRDRQQHVAEFSAALRQFLASIGQ
jgi:pimeloyl-ACP methyl ester carboxylesterase